jgi:hypothetical protein
LVDPTWKALYPRTFNTQPGQPGFNVTHGFSGQLGNVSAGWNNGEPNKTGVNASLLPEVGASYQICFEDPEPICDIPNHTSSPIYGRPTEPIEYTAGLKI